MSSYRCRTSEELRDAIIKEMAKTMTIIHDIAKENTEVHVANYYSVGDPDYYVRTGTLPNSAYTSALKLNGNELIFDTGYDQALVSWDTGTFSPLGVIFATENHDAGVLGNSHYYQKMQQDLERLIPNVFHSRGFK